MRLLIRIVAAMALLAASAHAQVIGLDPTPMATYYWDTTANAWTKCNNTSTAHPYTGTPQAFVQDGWNASLGEWTPVTSCPSNLAGFTITGFAGCGGTFEIGFSNTNPTCTASYSTPPLSASITNTDSIDSPLTLSSPFTSGTIVGTFVHTASATTTVTLTAVGSSTQTATQTMTWAPRSFGGVGAAGATSSVTAAGTSAILSNSTVLTSLGLTSTNVGATYGPFVTSGSNVYLLLIGGSHAFIDAGTGFPFAFNAPIAVTFVNANGVSVAMFLYQSANPLFGTFNIKVTS